MSKLLRRASIAVTSDVYGHLIATIASDAVKGAAKPHGPHRAQTRGVSTGNKDDVRTTVDEVPAPDLNGMQLAVIATATSG